jgi:hypothetical protein
LIDVLQVKPTNVGGVAGGDKFIAEGTTIAILAIPSSVHRQLSGIFFKFAVDKGLYGGMSNAAKSAGHELKSLNVLLNLQMQGLYFPLFVVIDYLGFRVGEADEQL